MKNRILISFPIIILLIIIIIFSLAYITKKPPVEKINEARIILNEAEGVKSSCFATSEYDNAKLYFDSALTIWSLENSKNILSRDYSRTNYYTDKSIKFSKKAIQKTKDYLENARTSLAKQISSIENQISSFDSRYGKFPVNNKDQEDLVKSKLLLNESIINYNQSKYKPCKEKLDASEKILKILHRKYEIIINEYFQKFDTWKQWIESTISESKKKKSYCIVVDKFAREGSLYKNGTLQYKFEIELGDNWIGHKNTQGDKSTPEGRYKIKTKKSNGSTKYHKAFLIDYPNEEDKKRFELNKKNNIINKDAKIGSLIELHGEGGKGYDWTTGCVGVKNEDMDKLYKLCNVGTPITIVGSTRPLKEIDKDKLSQKETDTK